MSLHNLYQALANFELKFHELMPLDDNTVTLLGKSLAPEGIDEVMKVKDIADRLNLVTSWDGQHIEIKRHKK